MRVKDARIIKACEGLRFAAYLCPAGVWTIGYGHTRTAKSGLHIDESGADNLLRMDLATAELFVSRYVRLELNQNQFDALVSLVFNIGSGNFKASTLRMKLNRGDVTGAANEFWKWRRGGGKILPGLVKRRELEVTLFQTPVVQPQSLSPTPQTQYHQPSVSPRYSIVGAWKAYWNRT
tara:strand:+ start:1914 stop:2447 length:534 start_codon:yes stop_codon:yes gene_type:complete